MLCMKGQGMSVSRGHLAGFGTPLASDLAGFIAAVVLFDAQS